MTRSEGIVYTDSLEIPTTIKQGAQRLNPGELAVSVKNQPLVTLLGSCVAVCICDPVARIGGMNHFLLPGRGHGGAHSESQRGFYGEIAMQLLLHRLLHRGCQWKRLKVKVAGGGIMHQGNRLHVGADNARFILRYLKAEGLPVAAADLGGPYARKVVFYPGNGRLLIRKIVYDDIDSADNSDTEDTLSFGSLGRVMMIDRRKKE